MKGLVDWRVGWLIAVFFGVNISGGKVPVGKNSGGKGCPTWRWGCCQQKAVQAPDLILQLLMSVGYTELNLDTFKEAS